MAEPRRRTTLQFGRVEQAPEVTDAEEPAPTVRTPRQTLVQRRSPTAAQLPAEPPPKEPVTSPSAEPDAGRYSFVSPIRRRKT